MFKNMLAKAKTLATDKKTLITAASTVVGVVAGVVLSILLEKEDILVESPDE